MALTDDVGTCPLSERLCSSAHTSVPQAGLLEKAGHGTAHAGQVIGGLEAEEQNSHKTNPVLSSLLSFHQPDSSQS